MVAELAPSFRNFGNTVGVRFRALEEMIGNTPLLAINFRLDGLNQYTIYAKAEFLNLTGSIKDRVVLHVLRRAYRDGNLHLGDMIVEMTGGNTGVSYAALGRALGHSVAICTSRWKSPECAERIRAFGAHVIPALGEQPGPGATTLRSDVRVRSAPGTFLPAQLAGDSCSEAHFETTGPEIASQLGAHGLAADAFVAGVGTGGTVIGVGRYLKSLDSNIVVHPVEPAESPRLTTGLHIGPHRIRGFLDELILPSSELERLDSILAVPDGDAILMAQKLAKDLGLGVGVSSGANFLGAVRALERLGDTSTVATVFCDDNVKYLSSDLLREEPVRAGYLSPRIELLSYEALPRLC